MSLTRDQILDTAEEVLRRFGPEKATVVDVARALGVSHGSVYRHFPSKAALRDAVAERWLGRLMAPLEAVVAPPRPGARAEPAAARLRRWFDALMAGKRARLRDDPELFATYVRLVGESRAVVRAHVEHLEAHVAGLLASGVAAGELRVADPAATARAVLDSTMRFHNPVHADTWDDPETDAAFERVWALLLVGLGAAVPPTARVSGMAPPAPPARRAAAAPRTRRASPAAPARTPRRR